MSKALDEANRIAVEHKRQIIKGFLLQLNDDHIDLFNSIYGSVETIAPDKMDWAIKQCERTLNNLKKKNNKKID